MGSSLDEVLNNVLARATGPFSEKHLSALQFFGSGLAMGHYPVMLGPVSIRSKQSEIIVEDSDSEDIDIMPIIPEERTSESNFNDIMEKLKTNKNKIAFLYGYVKKLLEMELVEEAAALTFRYKHIRNTKNNTEDISNVLYLLYPLIHQSDDIDKLDWEQLVKLKKHAIAYKKSLTSGRVLDI
jgi:hypothetical protein